MSCPGLTSHWKTVEGRWVNFDLHGHGGGQSVTYQKGRGSNGVDGTIPAAFDGEHGWFWCNRACQVVTVTFRMRGEYAECKT